jgi:hypothetical protein
MTHAHQKAAEINSKAITTAIEILKHCGWKYILHSPDGQTVTNAKQKAKRPKLHSFGHLAIAEKFAAAIPGQPIVFSAGDIPLKNLRARITGEASRVFGRGNYYTQTDAQKKTVSIITGVPAKALATEIAKSISSIQQSQSHAELRLHS